jgi:hypothetical protein
MGEGRISVHSRAAYFRAPGEKIGLGRSVQGMLVDEDRAITPAIIMIFSCSSGLRMPYLPLFSKIMCDTSHPSHDLRVCHVDFATSRSTYM